MSSGFIYGRDAELEDIQRLVSRRRSFLIYGPSGVGKTLLIKHAAIQFPEVLYCADASSSQAVFRAIALELFKRGNRHVLRAFGAAGAKALESKSAVSIRGIVTEALQEGKHWIILDHLRSPSQSFAATLKDLCTSTETPLIAVARSDHMEEVGFLLPMYFDRSEKFALRPFDSRKAQAFAASIALQLPLDAANRDEAIGQIVRFSKGCPGAIISMLQMAADPKYVTEKHIKLSPLYIDFKLRWAANA
jgi:AAA+ ATPase superfamily predicted ATPase